MRYLILTLLPLSACLAPQGVMLDSPLAPLVRETLESTRTDLPILVLEDAATLPSGARASCHQDHIVLAREAQDEFDFFVAHELVHWYIDESPYAGLPHFIEEGLADWIACDLMGGLEGRIAQNIEIGTMSVDPRRLAVTGAGWSYAKTPLRWTTCALPGSRRGGNDGTSKYTTDRLEGPVGTGYSFNYSN
jgi:hypothetical protein